MEEDALRMRVYVGESDRHEGEALYKVIVKRLREMGVWGATAVKGAYGFGKSSVLHAASPLRLSQDLPVVVEAVDGEEKIREAVEEVGPLVKEGLITTEEVTVVHHVGEPGEEPSNWDGNEPGEGQDAG